MTDDELSEEAKKLLSAISRTFEFADDLDELAIRLERSLLQEILILGGNIHTSREPRITAKFSAIAERNFERMRQDIPTEIARLKSLALQLPDPLRTDVLTFLIRVLSDVESAAVSVSALSNYRSDPVDHLKVFSFWFNPIYEQAVIPAKRLADRIQAYRFLQKNGPAPLDADESLVLEILRSAGHGMTLDAITAQTETQGPKKRARSTVIEIVNRLKAKGLVVKGEKKGAGFSAVGTKSV